MVRRFRRLFPAFLIGIAIAVFAQAPVHAQTGQSQAITLTPASTDLAIDPGSSVSKSFDIINNGSETFNANITSSPYHVESASYDPKFTQLPGTVDASEWVKFSAVTAKVEGNKSVTIPYTVTVPKNTAPGGYYAVLFAETNTDDERTGVISHNKVGNILYITVNGEVKVGGDLIAKPLPALHLLGSVGIGAKVSNSGGTHFITTTTYKVTDFMGKEVYKATAERYVLPQTERDIVYQWTPTAPIGLYTVERSATIAGEVKTLPDQKILVLNPWLIGSIVFLLGILIGVPYQNHRRRRRASKKDK